jgi:hypothetical protein
MREEAVFEFSADRAFAARSVSKEYPFYLHNPHFRTHLEKRMAFQNEETFNEFFDVLDPTNLQLNPAVVVDLLDKLDSKKNPGSPLCFISPTNLGVKQSVPAPIFADALNANLTKLYAEGLRLETIRREQGRDAFALACGVGASREVYDAECTRLLREGVIHPTLLKIKSEPRKVGKRPRLVCMVSSVTNSVMRLVVGNYLYTEQEQKNISTATALDLTTPEATHALFEEFVANRPVFTSDVEGWEYAVRVGNEYDAMMMYMRRMNLVDEFLEPRPEKMLHYLILLGLFYASIHRVVQTPQGNLYTAPPGQVSSGELWTFSKNSEVRTSLADTITLESTDLPLGYNKSAGDDNLDGAVPNGTVEEVVAAVKLAYSRYGFVITDVAVQEEEFSFCSTTFCASGAYQENAAKAAANILYKSHDAASYAEQMTAFRLGFSLHPDYSRLLSIIESDVVLTDGVPLQHPQSPGL